MQQISFEPTGMLGLGWTINALLMTIGGGIGTILGPVVGAIAVYYLLTKQLESYQTLSVIIEGLLRIIIVRFAPRGLWPLLLLSVTKLVARRRRPSRPDTVVDDPAHPGSGSASQVVGAGPIPSSP